MKKTDEELDMPEIENNEKIKNCLQQQLEPDTAALALITTYNPQRITPSKVLYAQIGFIEELGIEEAITNIKKNNIDKLFLLINTFGGGVSSSFKIAQALRENFSDITVFIPHIAASGGTLIALTGNKIVMGDMSNISPIDVQMIRNNKMTSVNSMLRSFHALNELFSKTSEDDAPYPWKAMANKLDPVEFQEWVDVSRLMRLHAAEILKHEKSSLKDKADAIIDKLTQGYPVHIYTITYKEANAIFGDSVCFKNSCETYLPIWNAMKIWLRHYITEESGHHIIRYVLPTKKEEAKSDVKNEEKTQVKKVKRKRVV